MNYEDYIRQAVRTESRDFPVIISRLLGRFSNNTNNIRILHALMGMQTELGELVDNFKKYVFYGKESDTINIKEELGDLEWYLAILYDTYRYQFHRDEVLQSNIAKLRARYPEKFTEENANTRNLEAERNELTK